MKRNTILAGLALIGIAAVAIPALAQANQQSFQPLVVAANPTDGTPFVQDGRVEALTKIGNRVYVAGNFTTVKNWQGSALAQSRPFLFAYSATTGLIDTGFNPVLNAPVLALAAAPDGSGIYAGGSFSAVNSLTRVGLVKLDPATGATVAAFKGATGGGTGVYDLDVAGTKLYLVGSFTKVKGIARTRLAAVDLTTGALDPDLNLALTGQNTVGIPTTWIKEHHIDTSADGTKLMVVGDFSLVGGLSRTQVAMIDLTTSPDTVANWSTDRYPFQANYRTYVTSVDMDPTSTFAVVGATCCPVFSGPTPTQLGDHAARFELAPVGAVQPSWWTTTGTDTFTDVAISGSAVYVGGHFRWVNAKTAGNSLGGVSRAGLAALDPDTGVPFSWNPGRDRGFGVLDTLLTADQFIIGHDTNVVGKEWHPRLAAFPLAGGVTPTAALVPTLPVSLYALPQGTGDVSASAFDGTVVSAATVTSTGDWSWVRGAFTNGEFLYAGSSDGKMYKLTFDGVTWINPVDISTRTDYVSGQALNFASLESLGYAAKGLLHTRPGDSKLYWSGFNLESNIVAGYEYTVSGNGDGANWSGVRSLAVVGTTLYATTSDGNLISLPLVGKTPTWAAQTLVSGPALDGRNWAAVELVIVDNAIAAPPAPATPQAPADPAAAPIPQPAALEPAPAPVAPQP